MKLQVSWCSVFQVRVNKDELNQSEYMNTKRVARWEEDHKVLSGCCSSLPDWFMPSQSESYLACKGVTTHSLGGSCPPQCWENTNLSPPIYSRIKCKIYVLFLWTLSMDRSLVMSYLFSIYFRLLSVWIPPPNCTLVRFSLKPPRDFLRCRGYPTLFLQWEPRK